MTFLTAVMIYVLYVIAVCETLSLFHKVFHLDAILLQTNQYSQW